MSEMREDIESAWDDEEMPDGVETEAMVVCEHCGKKTPASNAGGASVGGGT